MTGCRRKFRIATFNLKRFGRKKIGESSKIIEQILTCYEIIALQELQGVDESDLNEFLKNICRSEGNLEFVLSESEGVNIYYERYAVIYRRDLFRIRHRGRNNLLRMAYTIQRNAMVLSVYPRNRIFPSFTMFVLHTTPRKTATELNRFFEGLLHYMLENPGSNILIIGDINAAGQNMSDRLLQQVQLWTLPDFEWFVPSELDTTSTGQERAYDRIIAYGIELREALRQGGPATVYNFPQLFGLRNTEDILSISDHLPVERTVRALPREQRHAIRASIEEKRKKFLRENRDVLGVAWHFIQEEMEEAGFPEETSSDMGIFWDIEPEEFAYESDTDSDCECEECKAEAKRFGRNNDRDNQDRDAGTGGNSASAKTTTAATKNQSNSQGASNKNTSESTASSHSRRASSNDAFGGNAFRFGSRNHFRTRKEKFVEEVAWTTAGLALSLAVPFGGTVVTATRLITTGEVSTAGVVSVASDLVLESIPFVPALRRLGKLGQIAAKAKKFLP